MGTGVLRQEMDAIIRKGRNHFISESVGGFYCKVSDCQLKGVDLRSLDAYRTHMNIHEKKRQAALRAEARRQLEEQQRVAAQQQQDN